MQLECRLAYHFSLNLLQMENRGSRGGRGFEAIANYLAEDFQFCITSQRQEIEIIGCKNNLLTRLFHLTFNWFGAQN